MDSFWRWRNLGSVQMLWRFSDTKFTLARGSSLTHAKLPSHPWSFQQHKNKCKVYRSSKFLPYSHTQLRLLGIRLVRMHCCWLQLGQFNMENWLQSFVRTLQNSHYWICHTAFSRLLTATDNTIRLFRSHRRRSSVSGIRRFQRRHYTPINRVRFTQILWSSRQLGHLQARSVCAVLCSHSIQLIFTW